MKYFALKIMLATVAILLLMPNLEMLETFIFGFNTPWLKMMVLLMLIVMQLLFLARNRMITLLLWVIMLGIVLNNSHQGWPSGLMVNLLITVMSVPTTFLIAMLLAIARIQRDIYLLRWVATLFIEVVRGIPLIGLMIFVLTMGADMVPATWVFAKISLLWTIYSVFAGVYLAEVFRGGFEAVPYAYYEGGLALGLSKFRIYFEVLIPKVVVDTLPAAFNVYIGLFKETSLVLMFGYFDLMNMGLNYLDLPAHYSQSTAVYTIILALFWLIATFMHQIGAVFYQRCRLYQGK